MWAETASSYPAFAGAASVTDREWILATLGGCNRFSASYRLAGDSLSFGPVVSTKMSCADGDQLERSFLAMLPAIATYQATDSALTLLGPGGVSARFR